jgi:hypothetical protein
MSYQEMKKRAIDDQFRNKKSFFLLSVSPGKENLGCIRLPQSQNNFI